MEKENKMYLGKIVKEYRTKNSLRQVDFVDRDPQNRLSLNIVAKAEKTPGYAPTPEKIVAFAAAMRMSPSRLFGLMVGEFENPDEG